uniref:Uncharacterized protein n=1 Tax=Caenorhabditis japonica TaxID=281687 RepID=A0A8R1IG03_CAEJA
MQNYPGNIRFVILCLKTSMKQIDTCIAMNRELNRDAFKQRIWRAHEMYPNPVQFHVAILPGRAKAEYFEGGAILMERTVSALPLDSYL